MISRTGRASLRDYFRYFKGANPCDVWEFDVDGLRGKIVNDWRHGVKLYVGGAVVAHNEKLLAVSGKMPMLTATVVDGAGTAREVEVFVRALLQVKVRVQVDGRPILDKFI